MYILLILTITLLLISISYTKDIMAPSTILCLSYLLAELCAFMYSSLAGWELEIHSNTILIVSMGLLVFVFFFIITQWLLERNIKVQDKYSKITFRSLECDNKSVFICILLFQIIILGVYTIYFVKNIGFSFNLSSFSQMMNSWKLKYYYSTELARPIPFWVTTLVKISRGAAYVSFYLFFSEYFSDKTNKKRKMNKGYFIMSIVLYFPIIIMSAERWNLIILMISGMMIWYVLHTKLSNTKSVEIKVYVKIIIVVCLICIVFTATRSLVGRQSHSSIIEYVVLHFGCSIQNLDLFLQSPIAESSIKGKETFVSLHRFLYQIGIDKEYYTIHLEFRVKDGVSMGNVYTGLREYYYDFGLWGVFILQAILAIGFSYKYFCVYNRNYRENDVEIIWYCVSVALLFFHAFSEGFYKTFISFDYLVLYFIVTGLIWTLKRIKIRIK